MTYPEWDCDSGALEREARNKEDKMPRYFENYQEFANAVYAIFPDAVINEDGYGELVVNTGMAETTVEIVPLEEARQFWADRGKE